MARMEPAGLAAPRGVLGQGTRMFPTWLVDQPTPAVQAGMHACVDDLHACVQQQLAALTHGSTTETACTAPAWDACSELKAPQPAPDITSVGYMPRFKPAANTKYVF